MSYRNGSTPFPATYKIWSGMIKEANQSLEIASYYWTLLDKDVKEMFGFRRDKYPGSDEVCLFLLYLHILRFNLKFYLGLLLKIHVWPNWSVSQDLYILENRCV